MLRPGGRLLVTVPYHGRVQAASIALSRFDAHFDPQGQHLRFFTRALAGRVAGAPRGSRGAGRRVAARRRSRCCAESLSPARRAARR